MAEPLLFAIHDRDAHAILPAGGWCVDAVLVTDTPPNYAQIRGDINWIVRLNHGWYPDGTIPLRSGYPEYAKRCADFVQRCKGVDWFIVSNEVNHLQELPHGVPISPEDYADCFNACYAAIKTLRKEVNVLVAAIAPWDITYGIDWLGYYRRMLQQIDECDGLAVHGYTHGPDPSLIYNFDEVNGWCWHFPVIYQTIEAIPAKFADLPIHVTETNQGDNAWVDVNSGWVQNAYESIHNRNLLTGTRKIMSLALYRWRGDKWAIADKPQVQADFQAAVARGYPSPTPTPEPSPEPTPEPEPIPPPDDDTYLIAWDPRLDQRGVTLTVAQVPVGQSGWHVISGEWFDEYEAQGRINVFVTVMDENGNLISGEPVTWFWQDGEQTKITEVKNDPWLGHPYSLDFSMNAIAPSYGLRIGSLPTDVLWGMGLGSIEQPDYPVHTAYDFTFQLIRGKAPEPTPTLTLYVAVEAGANLRAEPSTSSAILLAVPYGEAVEVVDLEAGDDGYDWSGVEYAGIRGWIRSDLLSLTEPEPIVKPQPPDESLALIWPVRNARITQRFGENLSYYGTKFGILGGHNGIDFALPAGSPIYAIADGVVTMVGNDVPGYGMFCRLSHMDWKLGSLYAHCSELLVSEGDWVRQGQTIALVGSTGNSTGSHLHYELCALDESGYVNVSYGHTKGRLNPEVAHWLMGEPPVYRG